ncbi:acyl-CoA dehydrogenase family protein [Microbacterium sp. NPDC089189]|uniref:acyl-CoA dehydrogenase family protein n=1 Tax=Microbacterium sp. NPDC089189 TaxID=3154972 RepID=UPI00344AC45F
MSDDWNDLLTTWGAQAVSRERDRDLLFDAVDVLRGRRFGALRLPVESGGAGADLATVFARLIELAAADASLAHLWRGHLAFVEGLRWDGLGTDTARRWIPRIAAGDVVGNAFSERHETAELTTRVVARGGALRVSGVKHYTTGSLYADWVHVAALDDTDTRVALTVPATARGVRIVDDWDGFGQQLTGSGTTILDEVEVDPADIRALGPDDEDRHRYIGGLYQLTLLAVVAGIARRAVEDTAAFVRPRRRTFGFSGEHRPADDPLVQLVLGEVSAAAAAARRLVLSLAADLDAAGAGHDADALAALELEVYRAQHTITDSVLAATTRLFEVGGASATGRSLALDRHWRNVRTIASHNPTLQRVRAVGRFELDGTPPEWSAPAASPADEVRA